MQSQFIDSKKAKTNTNQNQSQIIEHTSTNDVIKVQHAEDILKLLRKGANLEICVKARAAADIIIEDFQKHKNPNERILNYRYSDLLQEATTGVCAKILDNENF